MTTNFFQILAAMQTGCDWKMTVSHLGDNQLIVSLLLTNDKIGDDARKLIPPMLFKGTPQEIDEGFFTAIEAPAKQTAALFANMEQYAKAMEEAKLHSKMEKEQGDKDKKEKEERRKKYEAALKKVAELEEQKKYGEAIGQMPKPEQFPEQEEEINEKLAELYDKRAQKTLF